ncbi:helix-turn-helix transcriptional regulator [Lysinibacillus sp. FSL W8-0992]|uniref:helix-turn-helix transcriptional regulator n=1 Tax=Lysinibacillus sp. FSL W8-0992 TaxID=2954643 RepID=UPI0030F8DA96
MFQDILKERRKTLGLSQEQVSILVGVERSYYTKIENGLRPSVKVAQAIGRVLNVEWTIFFIENGAKIAQTKTA